MPVRQGDILFCRDPSSGATIESCLVITADCDISKRKFGSHLACLRIDLLHDYVRREWARGKFERSVAVDSERLRSQLAKWHALQIGRTSNLTSKGVEDWARRESAESICNSLGVPLADKKKLVIAIDTYMAALLASEGSENMDFLTRLVKFKAAASRIAIDRCLKEVLAQAQGESLPDDVFLLPSIPHVKHGAALVKLREVIAIGVNDIKYGVTEADSPRHYLRTGRLQPTLKYAISQKFGALYSKIGLSSDFEDRHKRAIESVSLLTAEGL